MSSRPQRTRATWQPLDLSGVTDRLESARDLLRQAAALTAARDAQTLAAMTEQQRTRTREERDGHPQRRRYR
jgi:hypothetical protein